MPAAFIETSKSPTLSSDGLPFDAAPTMLNGSPTSCSPPSSLRHLASVASSSSSSSCSSASHCTCQCPRWTRPRHWIYRGEGNASVVLAVPQDRKIVRLAKIDHKLRRMDSDAQFSDAAGARAGVRTIGETLERLVFSEKIFGPLLGAGLVRHCSVYHLDTDEMDAMDQELDTIRPAHRKHKRLAPVCHVIVCDDCTLLPAGVPELEREHHQNGTALFSSSPSSAAAAAEPVFCVEVKPKQGFLAEGHRHCPFCLNQFLKRKHGKIQVLSEYCPLDLFSGSRCRMLKAVAALTRTPQNNLRIFEDGNLVFADECQEGLTSVLQRWFHLDDDDATTDRSLLKHFCALITEALTVRLPESGATAAAVSPGSSQDDWKWLDERRDHFSPCADTHPSSQLPDGCVLSRLLRVQSLGNVQFKRLYDAYDALADRMRSGAVSYDQLRWTDDTMTPDWLAADDDETHVKLVQRYRISSTGRDCSVMITFQRLVDGETSPVVVRDLSGVAYKCHASVVDVDPKPVSCVDKHRRRDLAMNEAFAECRSRRD